MISKDELNQLGDIEAAITQWGKAKELGDPSKLLNKKLLEGKLYE